MKTTNFTLSIIFILAININNVLAQEAASAFNYKTEFDISYYNAGVTTLDKYKEERCKLDIYYPTTEKGFTTVIWFHAGGLKSGDRFIPEQLKNQGIAIVTVDYRLHPKVSSPAYIEDAAAAVAWVFNNIEKFNGNSKKIYLSGHSAGGYLVSMLGLDKKWLSKHAIDANRIAGLIPFSGHAITHFTIREEKGIPGEQPIIDDLAPLFHVRADAPPLVLITGDRELELLGRYEENAYLMRMMKVVGHKKTTLYELQGFDHGGMADPAFSILLKHVKTNAN